MDTRSDGDAARPRSSGAGEWARMSTRGAARRVVLVVLHRYVHIAPRHRRASLPVDTQRRSNDRGRPSHAPAADTGRGSDAVDWSKSLLGEKSGTAA